MIVTTRTRDRQGHECFRGRIDLLVNDVVEQFFLVSISRNVEPSAKAGRYDLLVHLAPVFPQT